MINYLKKIYWAYRNKVTNKLFGFVTSPCTFKKRGEVLIYYITEPFTYTPWEKISPLHSSHQEAIVIANLFNSHRYNVDIVNASNNLYLPKKQYDYILDTGTLIDRLNNKNPKTKTIFYVLGSHSEFQNKQEQKRIDELFQRKGVLVKKQRHIQKHRSAEKADFIIGLGNKNTYSTYKDIKKEIFSIPISTTVQFDSPSNKNFDSIRKNFVWIGGGGMVHKGLDLALEVFKKRPEWTLHICGPVEAETDFVNLYREELYDTENIHLHGRIHPDGKLFKEIADGSIALIYPSSSEGQAGSVITAMHAGLIPVISKYSGVDTHNFGLTLKECTMEEIEASLSTISNLPTDTLKEMSTNAWKYANTHHTKESFSRAFEEFLTNVVKI